MQKKIICLLLIIFGFFMATGSVYAKDVQTSFDYGVQPLAVKENCDAIFGDPKDKEDVAYFLQEIFNVIKFVGPILALALCILDFVKAVASSDKDALIKAGKTSAKRVIYALLLFFIPTLINAIFGMIGFYGTCGIS